MEKPNKFLEASKKIFSRLFGRNLLLKILSLLFAILLWGYVIAEVNPTRTKILTDVNVSFEGEADLLARGLVVRGIRSEILEDIEVGVATELTQYADLSASDITATVSLRNVMATDDDYRAKIDVTASMGTVESVNPQYLYLEIESLATKSIPVEVQYEGELPESYWAGTPQLSRESVEIRGAAQDVNRVSRAVCRVALADRTSSYNDAVNVTFLDGEGNEIDSQLFLGETPAVTVKLQILPKKTVPVNLAGALLGSDSLAANYEIVESTVNPATVEIAGTEELLSAIDELELESIDLSGRSQSLLEQQALKVPEGIQIIGSSTVEVFVNIQEKMLEKAFVQIPVEVTGLEHGYEAASITPEAIDLFLKGRVTLVTALRNEEILVTVDATGLTTGIHTLPVTLSFQDPTVASEVTATPLTEKVTVRIRKK